MQQGGESGLYKVSVSCDVETNTNMISFRMLLCALALMLLAADVDSSSTGGSKPNYSCDLSVVALTRLYNSPVFKAEKMKRPLDGFPFMWGPVSHSGVRVTLADGSQWLVHKGKKHGISSQTVVTDARHMSSKWKVDEMVDFQGTKKVSDFVAIGGSDYNVLFDNCHMGSCRMMNQ